MINKKDIQISIRDINMMRQTHIDWAIYFETNPDIEKEYIKTGEWDTAKEHRNIIAKYDNVLGILKQLL